MELDQLHFAYPIWLWGLLALPLLWGLFVLFYKLNAPMQHLGKFIDAHLLPYLLVKKQKGKGSNWKTMLLWSFVWSLLILALAGPRWSFREIEVSTKDQSLVILLDLSESMNATDIKPSRLIRAKQKIEDLLNSSTGVKIGLVAFAADPHMIAPITDDKETIRYLLPSLDTDLVYVQGSRLSTAFEMASTMLDAEPGSNKAILIISDGDFEDTSALAAAKKISQSGITIHAMGVGTIEGAILQDKQGNNFKKNGTPILSKLLKKKMEDIAKTGNGVYLDAKYTGDEEIVLSQLESRADAVSAGQKRQLWDEHFYLLILPVLPIILWWFRRGAIFALFFLMVSPSMQLRAGINEDYFLNAEERGKYALDQGDYQNAIDAFHDPYKKGVAYYKAGNFKEAEKMFRQASSGIDSLPDAAYNLGNTYVQQQKFKKAISAYEGVLKKWPDHTKARENLALVKKMMEEQKKDKSQSDNSDKQKDENDENDEDSESNESQDKKQNSKNSKNSKDNKPQKDKPENQENQDNEDNEDQQDDRDKEDKQDKDDKQNKNDDPSSENVDEKEEESGGSEGGDSQDQDQDQQQGNEEEDKQTGSDAEEEQDGKGDDEVDDVDREEEPAEANQDEEQTDPQDDAQEEKGNLSKSQQDQEADFWLNRINVDPKQFMKNKFYIESKKNETKEGIDPW